MNLDNFVHMKHGVVKLAAMLLALFCGVPCGFAQAPPKPMLYYIVTTPTEIRERADSNSKLLGTVKPLDYLAVQSKLPAGWFRITMRKPGASPLDVIVDAQKATMDAFVKAASEDHYMMADNMDAVRIVDKIARKSWAAEVKAEVAKKRVREGFTQEQVTLALGEPDQRAGQSWTFSKPVVIMREGKTVRVLEHRIMFANGKVKSVERKEESAR